MVIAARGDTEVRRGRDYVWAVIMMTVDAVDVAEALDATWQSIRKATGGDTEGWRMPSAAAEVPVRRRSCPRSSLAVGGLTLAGHVSNH